MSAGADHLADVQRMRELAGKPMALHQRLAYLADGAAALAKATSTWKTFAPGPSRMEGAATLLTGLSRELALLRAELSDSQETPSAA